MTTSGAPLAVTLDGVPLDGVSPETFDVRGEELVTQRQASDATRRESRPDVAAGEAAKTIKFRIVAEYRHLRDGWAARVDRMLSAPGQHRLILWKHVELAFAGDGASAVFTLPRPFARDAVDQSGAPITTPSGRPWNTFDTAVYLAGPLGAAITATRVDQATWDGGSPAAGVVWQLEGAPQIKLAAAGVPAAGSWIYVSSVPEFRVLVVPGQGVSYRGPIAEPRRLELVET